MSQRLEKFETQVNSEILAMVRSIAETEGRELQALVEEALADVIEKRKNIRPRAYVIDAYFASHDKYDRRSHVAGSLGHVRDAATTPI